jgi:hypothetical protein
MNTTKIIITNVLPTNSAFAVMQDDHKQNVFIPSKVFDVSPFEIGDDVDAVLVPNGHQHDKTPWLAARIIAKSVTAENHELRSRIVSYLHEYDAIVQDLVSSLGANEKDIEDALTDLARAGHLVSETVYSLQVVQKNG